MVKYRCKTACYHNSNYYAVGDPYEAAEGVEVPEHFEEVIEAPKKEAPSPDSGEPEDEIQTLIKGLKRMNKNHLAAWINRQDLKNMHPAVLEVFQERWLKLHGEGYVFPPY